MLIQETRSGSIAAEMIPDVLTISRYFPEGFITNVFSRITINSVESIPVRNAIAHTIRFSFSSFTERKYDE